MANNRVLITRSEAVERAKIDCQRRVNYELGRGGFSCTAPFADQQGEADCSGAVAHFIGIDRQTNLIPGGWIETSLCFSDATTTRRLFVKVPMPRPGDIVVYPDKGKSQGHIGMIMAVDSKGKPTYCCHCTARSSLPNAMVNEKWSTWWGPNFTKRGMIFAAPIGYDEEGEELEKIRVIINGVETVGYRDPEANDGQGLNFPSLVPEEKSWSMERGAVYEWNGKVTPKVLTITLPKTAAAGVYSTDSDDDSA